jgi:hypothetical protein
LHSKSQIKSNKLYCSKKEIKDKENYSLREEMRDGIKVKSNLAFIKIEGETL